jgi:NAD(P)H-nitrite reductase large subunit
VGLRQNQDAAIGLRRKPASIEALKAHREMTREYAECCGETWARCGEPVAVGSLLPLRGASFFLKNRIDENA